VGYELSPRNLLTPKGLQITALFAVDYAYKLARLEKSWRSEKGRYQ
jgi:hypothetical protein